MIGVNEALNLIRNTCLVTREHGIPVAKSLGLVLSRDIKSPISLPAFDQSAMDGYAFRYADLAAGLSLRVVATVPAGKVHTKKLQPGEAVRIFTGAALPTGMDTVVMQEHCEMRDGALKFPGGVPERGINIRLRGSQIRKGETALSKGQKLNAAAIGFLASMGLKSVRVHLSPRVAVLVNGSELKKTLGKQHKGKIYESNSYMLQAALQQSGIHSCKTAVVRDDPKLLLRKLKTLLRTADLVLITGGISTGDFDFTRDVLPKAGVREVFYKVRQKPGKPLYFGMKGKTAVFALPGNPAAALSCFYEYVIPAINSLSGGAGDGLVLRTVRLLNPVQKKKGMSHFLKGILNEEGVRVPEGQESYILRSFAVSNCLVLIPEDVETILPNELVQVHLLPG